MKKKERRRGEKEGKYRFPPFLDSSSSSADTSLTQNEYVGMEVCVPPSLSSTVSGPL